MAWFEGRGEEKVTAGELQYLIVVFGTHLAVSIVPSLNIAAVMRIIIAVWIGAVLVLHSHEFNFLLCCVFSEIAVFFQ
jgi:hypothetical protein